MAHFAELDENNVVLRVVTINNEVLRENVTSEVDGMIEVTPIEKESKGISFLKGLYGVNTIWKQTSYNNGFRGKYAGVGDTFIDGNFVTPVIEEVVVTEQIDIIQSPSANTDLIQSSTADQIISLSTDQIQSLSTEQISSLGV